MKRYIQGWFSGLLKYKKKQICMQTKCTGQILALYTETNTTLKQDSSGS